MGCCRCRACCCCCDSRTGSVFVGIVNLVSGTVGIVALYFILTGLTEEMNQLQNAERSSPKIEQKLDSLVERYWSILLANAFPAVVTFLVGLSAILASAKNNEYLLLVSVFMNGILIIALFSISVILFVLALDWVFISPLILWGVIQIYFTSVMLDYRSRMMDIKENEETDDL